jgi:hypothetical protein
MNFATKANFHATCASVITKIPSFIHVYTHSVAIRTCITMVFFCHRMRKQKDNTTKLRIPLSFHRGIGFHFQQGGQSCFKFAGMIDWSCQHLIHVAVQALPAAGGVKGKLVVDVGSRMGCVVYAAAVLGRAGESVGIEINEDFCALQRQAFEALGVAGKARVICGDVRGKI